LRVGWSGRRRLHFATHGRLNEDVPLYSAVVLSQPEGGRDEGLLFARDLLDEDLSAELVVLSACETGLGRRMNGEGLLGMTWAWFVAGVPSTVASQWPVADDSTARLMQAFYAELKGGAPKAEALRRAQLALLKDRKTRHPFYWAPFVLSGDPW
jgi:CHAT domain-containing protein